MPRLALTDRFVLGAKSDDAPQTDYFDSKTPGLALRVSNGGHKAWTFIFTAPDTGKRTRITLGSYPALTLSSVDPSSTIVSSKSASVCSSTLETASGRVWA